MNERHAPAPWKVEPFVDAIHIHDANGEMVCDVSDRKIAGVGMPPENAQLIAAAPDMLTMLIRIRDCGDLNEFPSTLSVLNSVIAKAQGVMPDR
jgi:hypothetical protein